MSRRRLARSLARGAAILALLGAGGVAQASQLGLLSQTGLISGRQSFMFAMDVSAAGTLQVNLSDLNWQGKLADLSFSVVDSAGRLLESRPQALAASVAAGAVAPAQKVYEVTTPGTYSVYVSGTATGKYSLGLYSVTAMLESAASPVPLPAGALLLMSGLGALGAALRRRRAAAA